VSVGRDVKVVDEDIVVGIGIEGDEFGGDACGEVQAAKGAIVG
jgi:hypothetical protein